MRLSTALTAFLILSSADDASAAERRKLVRTTDVDGDCDEDRKCGLCEGDCDEDTNCKDGLKCFQREGNENENGRPKKVPGCELGDDDRPDVDYCYDPTWEETEAEADAEEKVGPTPTDPPSVRPTPGPTQVPSSMPRTAGPTIVEERDNTGNEQNEVMEMVVDEAEQNDEVIDEDTNADPECGGPITKRAQECGGSRISPETCCPGYICEGKDSVRCTVDPEAPITASVKPAAIRRPTPSPTRLADKKPRTWNTLMPDYILTDMIKLEPPRIQRAIVLERDAFKFTENPSAAPSSTPSSRPSLRPSASPTGAPTANPTDYPTVAPTRMRKDECKIEMYYEKKWCWHDDARNSNCDYDYEYCIEETGDWNLQMIKCSESPDSWQVIGHTVRPKNDKKLCWTRRGESGIRLMECDEEEGKGKWADQRFEGVCMNKPHKIRPLADKKWCLTSGHEPRSEEQIKFQECDKVDNSNTHLWIEK